MGLKLPKPLYKARIIERTNRFVLKCQCCKTKSVRKIYLADTGRLPDIIKPDRKILYHPADKSDRKTDGTAVLANIQGKLISINSHRANESAAWGIKHDSFSELKSWQLERREFKWNKSRFDFLLTRADEKMLLEVKSVTLVRNNQACFPDAVTSRGKRHLEELIAWQKYSSKKSAVLFLVSRNDAEKFRPCSDIDPDFTEMLHKARNRGVEILAYTSNITLNAIEPDAAIEQNW